MLSQQYAEREEELFEKLTKIYGPEPVLERHTEVHFCMVAIKCAVASDIEVRRLQRWLFSQQTSAIASHLSANAARVLRLAGQ